MKKSNTQDIAALIREYFEEEPQMHEGMLEHQALLAIDQTMPMISRYISGKYIRDSVLHLHLTSSTVRHQLMLDKAQLLRRINDHIESELLRDLVCH